MVKAFLVRTHWTFVDYLAAIAVMLLSAGGIAWVVYDVTWDIEIHSIVVAKSQDGRAVLDIDRELHGNFEARYRVTIRDAQNNQRVCTTGWVEGPYEEYIDKDGEVGSDLTQLPNPTKLTWWAGGGSCDEQLRGGLDDGIYRMETCHEVRPYRVLPWKEKCWVPVLFTIPPQLMLDELDQFLIDNPQDFYDSMR